MTSGKIDAVGPQVKPALKTFVTAVIVTMLGIPAASIAGDSSQSLKDLNDLITLIPGEFNNDTQIISVESDTPAAQDTDSFSRLRHHRLQINSPHLTGDWIYAQINKDKQPEAYRQSVLEFYIDDKGVIRSRAWSFKAKGMKEKGMPSTEFLSQLSPEQLVQGLPDSCSTEWHRRGAQFEGSIDHRECVIQSKYKDEKRQLFAEELIFKEGMWAREGAYRMDGELAFGLKENQFYKYQRTR